MLRVYRSFRSPRHRAAVEPPLCSRRSRTQCGMAAVRPSSTTIAAAHLRNADAACSGTEGGGREAAGAPTPIRPTALVDPAAMAWSVNQTLPSEPVPIPPGRLPALSPLLYIAIACVAGSIFPIDSSRPCRRTRCCHRGLREPAQCGARVQADAELADRMRDGINPPDRLRATASMNQRAPSGPTMIEAPGLLPGLRPLLNSAIACVRRVDHPDRRSSALVGKPEIAVRPCNEPLLQVAARIEADGELADLMRNRIDHSDRLGRAAVGEPDVAVRAGRDPERHAVRAQPGS